MQLNVISRIWISEWFQLQVSKIGFITCSKYQKVFLGLWKFNIYIRSPLSILQENVFNYPLIFYLSIYFIFWYSRFMLLQHPWEFNKFIMITDWFYVESIIKYRQKWHFISISQPVALYKGYILYNIYSHQLPLHSHYIAMLVTELLLCRLREWHKCHTSVCHDNPMTEKSYYIMHLVYFSTS